MQEQKSYLSLDKLKQLKEELEYMKTAKRQEIAERLGEAKKLGDLSENAEYAEAKDAQEDNELKIMELEQLIKNAVIIEQTKTKDKVEVGSTVEVKLLAGHAKLTLTKKTERYMIVGSEEADPASGKISNSSPLGRAFLGHKVGDEVDVQTPQGLLKYSIVKIL